MTGRTRTVLLALGSGLLALVLLGFGAWHWYTAPAGEAQAVELADAELPSRFTDATVLAVGEATHGTAEFREAWTLVALKSADKGFTTIALEDNAGSVSQVDAWLQGGPGTAEQAAQRMGFALNRTEQSAAMLTRLREWNAKHPKDPVRLYGLDIQRAGEDRDLALAWLRSTDPAAAAKLAPALARITRDTAWEQDRATAAEPAAKQLAEAVERVAAGRTDDATLRARLSARALVQGMQRGAQGIGSYDRDRALHQNLRFLVEERARVGGKHTLLLAHNGHVDRAGVASMAAGSKLGVWNAKTWGQDYRVIGTQSHRTRLDDDGSDFSFDVSSPSRGIFTGTRIGFLDLAEATPVNRRVLGRRQPMASAGSSFAAYQAWIPFLHEVQLVPAEAWDALVHVEDSHPTVPLGQ